MKKVKAVKECKWNTPLHIPLDPAHTTVVGRLPASSGKDNHCVVLHSEKLPYMLSRQHASLAFDKEQDKWMIQDLKSLNGVYVNSKRIKVCVATPLTDSDEICFGSVVPTNELKYMFFLRDGKAFLERTTDPFSPQPSKPDSRDVKNCASGEDPECTPPLVKGKRRVVSERSSVKKKLKLEPGTASEGGGRTITTTVVLPTRNTDFSGTTTTHSDIPILLNTDTSTHPATPVPPTRTDFYSGTTSTHPATSVPPTRTDFSGTTSTPTRTDFSETTSTHPANSPTRTDFSGTTSTLPATPVPPTRTDFNGTTSTLPATPPTPPLTSSNLSASSIANPPLSDLVVTPAIFLQSSQVFSPHPISQSNVTTSDFQAVPSTSSAQDPPLLEPIQTTSSTLQAVTVQDSNITKFGNQQLGVVSTTRTTPSLPVCSIKPSPALSTFSTKSTDKEVEDLFDDIVSNSDERLLEEAIFGESTTTNPQPASAAQPMDGATIQVLAVQDQMQQERQKLLSNIEALKSELAAKNELITKQEKTNSEAGGVVTSMREEFTCVICQELFITAHTLSCSHSFCEHCIKEWMKTHKDCPICRKRSTTQPIRSLALDNAIAAVESKLSTEEKKERDAVKEERKVQMGVKVPTTSHSVVVIPATPTPSTSGHPVHVVPGHSSAGDVIVLDDDSSDMSSNDDSDGDDENDDDSDESSSESSADYSGGYRGYGGYGRCYYCGEHGHWRPQCPYR